jgi:hypothetical protein
MNFPLPAEVFKPGRDAWFRIIDERQGICRYSLPQVTKRGRGLFVNSSNGVAAPTPMG